MIQITNLQKNFGEKRAVDIANYTIHQGDMLGLVGNNGAGKTTLFRLILDLLQADNGNVTINGIDVSKTEDWKQFTGAFIDDGFLIDYLTPEEYFYFIGRMYGLKKEEVNVKEIKQYYVKLNKEDEKFDILCEIYDSMTITQSVIFCNMKKKVDWLTENMIKNNFV